MLWPLRAKQLFIPIIKIEKEIKIFKDESEACNKNYVNRRIGKRTNVIDSMIDNLQTTSVSNLPEQHPTKDLVLQIHHICNRNEVSQSRDLERTGDALRDLHHWIQFPSVKPKLDIIKDKRNACPIICNVSLS